MVRMRNLVKVGNREVKKRYIGNKLIFEDLGDKTEILSGTEIYTDKADDSVVHVEIDGKSYQDGAPTPDYPIEIHSLNDFDVVSQKSEGGMIDKINLLLSEPLRSLDDVKDRLFRDSDGLWKIERSVGEEVFENGDKWNNAYYYERKTSAVYGISYANASYMKERGIISLSHVPDDRIGPGTDENEGWLQTNPRLRIRLQHSVIGTTQSSVSAFKDWLKKEHDNGTPLTVVYELAEPTIEILDQELQDKLNNLRSFRDSNYVYTVLNKTDILPTVAENLQPTLHATFKSKGWYDYYKKTLLK